MSSQSDAAKRRRILKAAGGPQPSPHLRRPPAPRVVVAGTNVTHRPPTPHHTGVKHGPAKVIKRPTPKANPH